MPIRSTTTLPLIDRLPAYTMTFYRELLTLMYIDAVANIRTIKIRDRCAYLEMKLLGF